LTLLQDTRIERLERHVRSGAHVLQETQAALAEHTVMLMALGSELRDKVSTSDVDPSIQQLNRELVEARKRLEDVKSATRESWDKAQSESNAAFDQLRSRVSQLAEKMRDSLGLDKTKASPEEQSG
jgi:hypothetical protein